MNRGVYTLALRALSPLVWLWMGHRARRAGGQWEIFSAERFGRVAGEAVHADRSRLGARRQPGRDPGGPTSAASAAGPRTAGAADPRDGHRPGRGRAPVCQDAIARGPVAPGAGCLRFPRGDPPLHGRPPTPLRAADRARGVAQPAGRRARGGRAHGAGQRPVLCLFPAPGGQDGQRDARSPGRPGRGAGPDRRGRLPAGAGGGEAPARDRQP